MTQDFLIPAGGLVAIGHEHLDVINLLSFEFTYELNILSIWGALTRTRSLSTERLQVH